MPESPHVGSRFPVLRELASPDCEAIETDDRGRVTRYLCFGAATTDVTYAGDTELAETIVQTEMIRGGTVEQQLRLAMTWTADGKLASELAQTFHDQVWQEGEVSFETIFAADGSVAETHSRTRYAEDDLEDDAEGAHDEAFFTDDKVERSHRVQLFAANGQAERDVMLAGIDEIVASEAVYAWSPLGLSSVSSTRRVERSEEPQQGCTKPDADHIQCVTELSYDKRGALVSFVSGGMRYVVSDNCCPACIPSG